MRKILLTLSALAVISFISSTPVNALTPTLPAQDCEAEFGQCGSAGATCCGTLICTNQPGTGAKWCTKPITPIASTPVVCEGEFEQCGIPSATCCSGLACTNQPGTGAKWCTKPVTPTSLPSTAQIQGRRVDIDENAATAPVPADGVVSTITVKEVGSGTTIGQYTVRTSQYTTKIDNVDVKNTYQTNPTLTMGKQYEVSINPITGYKVYYSLNYNNIRHQVGGENEVYISPGGEDVMCTGAASDPIFCYREGDKVTVTLPAVLPKNADGTDFPYSYADIYWKYIPLSQVTINPTIPDSKVTPQITYAVTPVVTSSVPSPTLDPECQLRPKGDADCDEDIDQIDYQIWRCELLNGGLCTDVLILPTGKTATDNWANFSFQRGDTTVDLADFETWRVNTTSHVVPTLEPTLTGTPAVTPTDIPVSPTPTVVVPTVIGASPSPTKAPTAVPTATKTPAPTPTPSYKSRILFTSNRNGKSDIMVKELNGDERRLTANSENNYEPQISKNGQKIVFYSYRDLNHEIYIMNSDGTNEVRLTNDPAIDIDPTINADGTKVVYATTKHGAGNYELYMINADGSNPVRLTNTAGHDMQPHFSPDGNKIVFTSTRDGNNEIYTLDLTKPNSDPKLNYDPQRWTDSPDVDYEPAFHPTDNNKVVFNSNRAVYYRIFSMTLERTAQKRFPDVLRLNIIGNYTDLEPSYSSDGSRIIFRSNRASNYEIWVVDPTGQNHNRVTFNTETDISPVFFP